MYKKLEMQAVENKQKRERKLRIRIYILKIY
jgi:hypothetical protein